MNEGGRPLHGLHEVRVHGVPQKGGHDPGGRGDEKARLARHAVHAAAQAHDHLTEGAVVDVEHALPQHLTHVDAEGVAVVEVIVEGGGQEIVRGGDGVEIAREVKVDLLHGHDLGEPSARAAPLYAKGR